MWVARRIGMLLAAMALLAAACTDTANSPAPERAGPAQSPIGEVAGAEAARGRTVPEMRLLPDLERWVVIEDWTERMNEVFGGGRVDIAVAPVVDGIPVLSKRISVLQFSSAERDLEERFGDRAALGEPTIVDILGGGEAWIVADEWTAERSGIGWTTGIAFSISTHDPTVELDDFLASLQLVDAATWDDAIGQASANVELAVAAAMEDLPALEDRVEPLPHFVLPEPWRLTQVTDRTIWTDEQRAQEAAFIAATFAGSAPTAPLGARMDYFVPATGDASAPFLPTVLVAISEQAEPLRNSASPGDEPISALGLDGYYERRSGATAAVTLGVDSTTLVRVSTSTIGTEGIDDFLAQASFITDDPLEGLIVDAVRYQQLDVDVEIDFRPPEWHAWWEHPDGDKATISVWRMSLDELRVWLVWRDYRQPADEDWDAMVWRSVAERGLIDLGRGMTYDVDQGLLFALQNVAPSDLVAIDLDEWTELAAPLNTDPLRPR